MPLTFIHTSCDHGGVTVWGVGEVGDTIPPAVVDLEAMSNPMACDI